MTVQLGVLVSTNRYQRLLQGEWAPFRERVLRYEQEQGVQILVATPTQVDAVADRATMISAGEDGWQETTVQPVPRIYLNRLVRPTKAEARGLRDLNGNMGVVLFNETNRWHRQMLFAMLSQHPQTGGLAPPVEPLTAWPERPGLYLLAPARRMPSQGGYLLEVDGGPRLRYTQLKGGRHGVIFRNTAPADLSGSRPLLVSPLSGLPMGPYGPVEWRFYMVRGEAGGWAAVGGVAKRDLLRLEAPPRCWPVHEALSLTFGAEAEALFATLNRAAQQIVRTLTLFIPGISHCAVDLWLDPYGNPSVADLSGCFRTDWLACAGQIEALEYLDLYPVLFAQWLNREGVKKLDVDIGRRRVAPHH